MRPGLVPSFDGAEPAAPAVYRYLPFGCPTFLSDPLSGHPKRRAWRCSRDCDCSTAAGPGRSRPARRVGRRSPSSCREAAAWAPHTPAQATFADVPPTDPFYTFVETAACHAIISGYACGGPGEPCPGAYFRPAHNATRGQLSKMIGLVLAPR